MKHYLVEFDVVRQHASAKMVVQADTEQEAMHKAFLEVARQYNEDKNEGYFADISEATEMDEDEAADYDLNKLIDLEEY